MICGTDMQLTVFDEKRDNWCILNILSTKGENIKFSVINKKGSQVTITGDEFYKMLNKLFES